jgi:ketosteroid isomerase-like protein
MKNLFRPLFVMVCVLLVVSLSAGGPVRATNSSSEESIKFLEDAWVNAIVHRDVNALNYIMADDFAGISPNGYPYTKEEAITDVRSGSYVVKSMALDDVKVRLYGDIALVTFYQNEKSKFGDEDHSGRYSFTDVWVKRDGTWKAIASQGTPVVLP